MVRKIALASFLVLAGSGIKYSNTHDANFQFAKMESFQIVTDRSDRAAVRIHPQIRQQIDKVINQRMQQLGYRKSYPQQPDFAVAYRLESSWDPRLSAEEIRQRLGFSGGNFPDADPRARDYQVLSLVIELSSPADGKVIWSGRAEGVQYELGRSGWELVHSAEGILTDFQPGV